jgi:hypothetical protein
MKNETAEKARLLQGWRVFLLEYELAKHYHYPYILYAGTTNRNPLLDMLLPSLLMVRAVSILDDSLQVELQTQGITLPQGQYKDDLYGRISILCDNKTLSAKDDLQKLRRRRNKLSHEIAASATWEELSSAVDHVEASLQELKIVGPRPTMEYFGQRSAMTGSPDPNVLWTREFKCGIKENSQVALEFSWRQNILKDGAE